MRAMVVPDWLAEVVRPKPAPLPWPQMLRAALAICVPLAAGLALGDRALGVLPATGGILGVMSDTIGPYLNRVKRVASAYLEEALLLPGGSPGSPAEGALPARSRMRRSTYRSLADLRTEFQRTMSEPPSISRRATAWWPAVVALERVMDAGTATALAISRGAPAPPAGSVRMLCGPCSGCSAPTSAWPRPGNACPRGRLVMWSGWPDSNRRPPRPKIVMSVDLGC